MSDVLARFIDGLPALLVAVASLVLAVAGVWQVARALGAAAAGEGFSVYWQVGGFGTPGRGWCMSAPLTRLLAGLTLVALGAAMAPAVGSVAPGKPAGAAAASAASSAASGAAPAAPASAASR